MIERDGMVYCWFAATGAGSVITVDLELLFRICLKGVRSVANDSSIIHRDG